MARRPGIARLALRTVAIITLGTAALVLPLRWLPPLTTSFMLITWAGKPAQAGALRYQWMPRKAISPRVPEAFMAAEDQKFLDHHGFDLESISKALRHNQRGRSTRGGSTITQQLAKNLYLWPGRSWLRKGIEAWFTAWLEMLLPKERILELYANVVQFGPTVFGVEAAAQAYFGKPAARLNREEAALLAAVLPNPVRFSVARPTRYVQRRQQWILQQAGQVERTAAVAAAWQQ